MHPFPHVYSVAASGGASGNVALTAAGIPQLMSAAPVEFDGPGDQWSPESLLAAAVAGCFILTFRAIATASHLQWLHLKCDVSATLERVEGVMRFTRMVTHAVLTVRGTENTAAYERALSKAERGCLVANSLSCSRELQFEIIEAPAER